MNLLDTITDNPALLGQLAESFGLSQGDTKNAVGQLLPALGRGIGKNAATPGGLGGLLDALGKGSHQRYVDRPEELGRPETVADGNAILGHILGSKDVSRNVAGHAAKETGLDEGILEKMLPVVAAAVMGSLSKQTSGGGLAGLRDGQGGSAADLLGGFLDAGGDGSVADDLLGLAKKLF